MGAPTRRRTGGSCAGQGCRGVGVARVGVRLREGLSPKESIHGVSGQERPPGIVFEGPWSPNCRRWRPFCPQMDPSLPVLVRRTCISQFEPLRICMSHKYLSSGGQGGDGENPRYPPPLPNTSSLLGKRRLLHSLRPPRAGVGAGRGGTHSPPCSQPLPLRLLGSVLQVNRCFASKSL